LWLTAENHSVATSLYLLTLQNQCTATSLLFLTAQNQPAATSLLLLLPTPQIQCVATFSATAALSHQFPSATLQSHSQHVHVTETDRKQNNVYLSMVVEIYDAALWILTPSGTLHENEQYFTVHAF